MSIATPMGIAFPAVARRPTVTAPVTVYATWWNMGALRIRRALHRTGTAHHFVDIDLHPDAKTRLQGVMPGELELPIVYVDGDWLKAPSLDELTSSLQKHGLCNKL